MVARVFDDWSAIFQCRESTSRLNTRWVMKKGGTFSARWTTTIDRVFLLSDQPNSKAQGFDALALGNRASHSLA